MRKIGGHVSIAGGIINAVTKTQEIGGNCLQIFAGSPRVWARSLISPDQVKKFRHQIEQLDFEPVFIHALYLVNLCSDNPDLVQKSVTSLLFDLRNGDQLHAAGVIVHIGSHQGRGFNSVKVELVKSIQSLLDQSKNTPFIIENSAGQKGKVGSLQELAYLCEQLNHPRIKVCLDTAHLFEAGWDLRLSSETDRLVTELQNLNLLDKLACIHLNDSQTPLGSGRDNHANLGDGEVGTAGLKYFVNHSAFNSLPLLLEVPGGDKQGPDKINIDIAKSMI